MKRIFSIYLMLILLFSNVGLNAQGSESVGSSVDASNSGSESSSASSGLISHCMEQVQENPLLSVAVAGGVTLFSIATYVGGTRLKNWWYRDQKRFEEIKKKVLSRNVLDAPLKNNDLCNWRSCEGYLEGITFELGREILDCSNASDLLVKDFKSGRIKDGQSNSEAKSKLSEMAANELKQIRDDLEFLYYYSGLNPNSLASEIQKLKIVPTEAYKKLSKDNFDTIANKLTKGKFVLYGERKEVCLRVFAAYTRLKALENIINSFK